MRELAPDITTAKSGRTDTSLSVLLSEEAGLTATPGKPLTVPVPWTLGEPSCAPPDRPGRRVVPLLRGRPSHAGVKLHHSPIRRQLECWLVFACTEYVDEIDAARPLLERDEAVRRVWLEQRRQALAGRRWEPPKPLATGADAKQLHERALTWAASRS